MLPAVNDSDMPVIVREFQQPDIPAMATIWNTVVEAGDAFPQTDPLSPDEARAFFAGQTYTGVAVSDNEIVGLYILHPNNIGRCGHIANASFAVNSRIRGRGIGEILVRDCLAQGRRLGFTLLQFNAVVSTNTAANRLYEKLGFHRLGTIPGGFRMNDGQFADINLYYIGLGDKP